MAMMKMMGSLEAGYWRALGSVESRYRYFAVVPERCRAWPVADRLIRRWHSPFLAIANATFALPRRSLVPVLTSRSAPRQARGTLVYGHSAPPSGSLSPCYAGTAGSELAAVGSIWTFVRGFGRAALCQSVPYRASATLTRRCPTRRQLTRRAKHRRMSDVRQTVCGPQYPAMTIVSGDLLTPRRASDPTGLVASLGSVANLDTVCVELLSAREPISVRLPMVTRHLGEPLGIYTRFVSSRWGLVGRTQSEASAATPSPLPPVYRLSSLSSRARLFHLELPGPLLQSQVDQRRLRKRRHAVHSDIR